MSWQVNLGEGRGVHQLQVDTRLTFGRNTDCDIVVKSSSVESRHASITWDHASQGYIIHDLNTINGTFVNKEKPLFGSSRHLQSGDTFRLGCDKTHFFCFERVHDLSSSSAIADSATQTSPPQEQLRFISSPSLPSPSHVPVIHYIPIAEAPPTVLIPSSLHASTPYFLTQVVPYSAGPLSAPSIGRAKQNPVLSTETLATNSAAEEDRKPLKDNNKSKPECSRKDGRRSFEVDKIPSMSNLSPLYGRPAWWGDDDNPNTVDVSETGRKDSGVVPRQHTGNKATDHESPIIRGREDDTTFVVEIAAAKRQKPSRLNNNRSREQFSTTDSGGDSSRFAANLSQSHSDTQRETTALGKPPSGTKTKEETGKKTRVWSAPSSPADAAAAKIPPLPADIRNLTYVLETPLDEDEKLQSHSATTAVSSAHDRTLHSHSEVTLGQALTPVVGTGGGSRPGSARRQWKDSSHSEVLSNLMLAAVDARVKRLAEYSNETVDNVNMLLQSLATNHPEICTHSLSPACSPSRSHTELPQWKFDNQDLKNIFAGVKLIEKNLKDINASIQHLCVKGSVEEVGSERSSRNLEEDDKEDTSDILPDSMDEEEKIATDKKLH